MPEKRGTGASRAPTARVTCHHCGTRLDVYETSSGGRTIAIAVLPDVVEPKALERFVPPGAGPEIPCPACARSMDPAVPPIRRGPRRRDAL